MNYIDFVQEQSVVNDKEWNWGWQLLLVLLQRQDKSSYDMLLKF